RSVPAIVISGLDEMDSILKAIQMGAVDHLEKPFNPLLLQTRIDACLEKKRWHDQAQELLIEIAREKSRSEQLLLNILPKPIAERLKKGEKNIADSFPDVTVLFADLVGFTGLSVHVSPDEVVRLLNEIFPTFDLLAEKHGLEKIKTIGDCYMAVSGLPQPRADHAAAAADMVLDMVDAIARFNAEYHLSLQIRIGMHTGLVVAGVTGKNKFIYDLWGDTINTASRMETHSKPGRIQVSTATRDLLAGQFRLKRRGIIKVKGKGKMLTYWLEGRKP
ncbi:MAG: adenylate/guanylate cyclase domain-containing response regulator, partial [Pedosphaera parvula]|nr:adenylate/guanylate cyclase domain-containing response regulator [Pedosphaera parvula]